MKKLLASVAGAALMVTALAGCSGGSTPATGDAGASGGAKLRIAIVGKGISDFGTLIKNGALAAGQEFGADVTWNAPDTESEGDKQLNMLQDAVNSGVDGIGFAPQDGAQDGAPAILQQAKSANIPVAVYDTPLASSDIPIVTIASDNNGIGAMAAEQTSKLIGGKGKVALIVNGVVGTAALRRDGFVNWIKQNAPDIQIVDIQNGEADPAKARDKAQGILQAHPDLNALVGTGEYPTTAIADQVAAMGAKAKVVGVDSNPDILTLLRQGKIDGVVAQNPYNMGYQTVKALVEAKKGTMPSSNKMVSPSAWVTKDNMDTPEIKQITG
jgi:ribose transport system substrate-binding protein